MRNSILVLFIVLGFSSCEDPIDFEVEGGTKQLVVDAFLSNLDTSQVIYLKKSKDFFGDDVQEAAIGATVNVKGSDGTNYNFVDNNGSGEYIWEDSVLVHEGVEYTLEIDYEGVNYTAIQTANPVPPIDSLVVAELESFDGTVYPDSFSVELYAIDLPGRTDYYWIKGYLNGEINDAPNSILVTVDAAFGPGADGTLFIPPVRFVAFGGFDRPFIAGDKVRAEICSINENTQSFFTQARNQINNGGLFATPPSNVRTNIVSSSDKTEDLAVGFFDVMMVSVLEKTLP